MTGPEANFPPSCNKCGHVDPIQTDHYVKLMAGSAMSMSVCPTMAYDERERLIKQARTMDPTAFEFTDAGFAEAMSHG